jgi:phosphoribosylaminoimidazole synthetase
MVASALGSYETLGRDIVNHCTNDILVQNAEPLFFLDYVAASSIDPKVVASVVGGAAAACREAGCALLGGETAEMPGIYAPGQLDVAGTIVGVVERDEVIDGSSIVAGDLLVGLASSGLHTNGFTLARRVFPPSAYGSHADVLGRTLGETLVEPHRSYLPHVRAIRSRVRIKGMAHLTGGGFVENIPRVLPDGLGCVVNRSAWPVPPLFRLIEQVGGIDHDEMYRVFNMGIGLVIIVSPEDAPTVVQNAGVDAFVLGSVTRLGGEPRVALR